jgi:DNA-binding winged helix-turn-helix (wHTH) protein/TolB-like protein
MPSGSHTCVRFGLFEIDAKARVLRKSGVKIRLQEQPFEVLLTLLESPGEIVTREQLRQRIWPQGTFVEFDHALNTAVKKIRAALCDDAAVPRYIETIPRRGYRFLASLDTAHLTGTELNVESAVVRVSSPAHGRSFRPAIAACVLGIPFLILSTFVISRPSTSRNVTVAVLPFSNMNAASSQGAVTSVFLELLLRQLQRTHPAKLVIGNGSRAPRRVLLSGKTEQSHIDYVVQGGVLGDEQHLHVAVQLIRLSDQNCVWGRDFDRNSDDPQTEMEMAEEIVGQMQQTLASLSEEPR